MPVPPVTHYKDEAPETQEILNQEIEKEISESKVEQQQNQDSEKTPELKVLPVKSQKKKDNSTSASSIVNAFRQKMSLNTTAVELPSIGKTVEFKEISASEQKELSKIALENNSRADIMYCSMLALINRLAIDKSFDVRDHSEFERISITLNLQQMNKINPEIKYTCSKCGKENIYRLDTARLLREFAKSFKADQKFEVSSGARNFVIEAGWPKVANVEGFFKHYYKKYDNSSKSTKETMDNLSQIEYITMFLKRISVSAPDDPEDVLTADLEEMTYPERTQIIDCLPQSVLFDDDTGVISKVIAQFVTPMNDVFKYRDCAFCGAEQTGAMASMTDFLGAGA